MTFARKPFVRPPKPPITPLSEPSRGVIKAVGDKVVSVQKTEYVRSEAYRRYVASLACKNCGISGFSQCAHPNSDRSGAAGGKKASDLLCFPLCSVDGNDCHRLFDHYELCSKAEMPDLEIAWYVPTQYELILKSQEPGREALRLRETLRTVGLVK